MAGHKPWATLQDKMSPERRARIETRVKELEIGLIMAELRKQTGMTQEEAAEKLGITQPGISQIEAEGDIQVATLRKLVETYGGEVIIHMPDQDISLMQHSE